MLALRHSHERARVTDDFCGKSFCKQGRLNARIAKYCNAFKGSGYARRTRQTRGILLNSPGTS